MPFFCTNAWPYRRQILTLACAGVGILPCPTPVEQEGGNCHRSKCFRQECGMQQLISLSPGGQAPGKTKDHMAFAVTRGYTSAVLLEATCVSGATRSTFFLSSAESGLPFRPSFHLASIPGTSTPLASQMHTLSPFKPYKMQLPIWI